jgi:hypothetical protein
MALELEILYNGIEIITRRRPHLQVTRFFLHLFPSFSDQPLKLLGRCGETIDWKYDNKVNTQNNRPGLK